MDTIVSAKFRPPVPPAPKAPLSLRAFLRAVRTNALTIWPEAAYTQDSTERGFFNRKNVLLNAPDAIHHVLVGSPGNYRRSPASIRVLQPVAGEGLLLSEGDDWKLQRRTIAPALAPRVLPMLSRHIVASTERAVAQLKTRVGEPVDLLTAMQYLALDIAGRSMFSMQMERHGAALRALVTGYADRYSRPHLLDMLLPTSIPSPLDLGRRRFRQRWMRFIDALLETRLNEPEPETPRDLLDLLRAARDPDTGARFSAVQLRDQAATMILAGHETTAVTLFWAMILLAQAPAEQEWLAEEAKASVVEPETAYARIGELVRAKAVINETLRLFPPAFTIVREVIDQERIGAIDLPPRSVIWIAPWVLHRHRALWEDPEVFRPDRFMPDQPAPPRFAFMPFGAGPRVCVGAQFALTEAVLVLTDLVKHFRVERVGTEAILPVGIVTTQPDHPAKVRLTLRR